ncbi:MAG: hypothetical protein H0T52_13860, partial [Lautropia sp.]|nr:hypothetical protein [Lautropia sp.]
MTSTKRPPWGTRTESERIGAAIERDVHRLLGDVVKFDPAVYRSEQPNYAPPVVCEVFRLDGEPVPVAQILVAAPPAADRPGPAERGTAAEHADP